MQVWVDWMDRLDSLDRTDSIWDIHWLWVHLYLSLLFQLCD